MARSSRWTLRAAHRFQALQHRGSHPGHQIVFYAFDLLHLDGTDLTAEPLLSRAACYRLPG
jgi:ATP-dependent DNA ligase